MGMIKPTAIIFQIGIFITKMPLWQRLLLGVAIMIVTTAVYYGFLAWQGYIFPIHYVKTTWQGEVEECYRRRIDWNTWSYEGKWTRYFRKGGIKQEEGFYHHNHKVGLWTLWECSGEIRETNEYDNDGRLLQMTNYKNGVVKIIEKIKYDETGEYVGNYVTLNGITNFIKYVPNSATTWDSKNPDRNNQIEEAYQNEIRAGATEEEADEYVTKKYHL
jgi:hypothetical protein